MTTYAIRDRHEYAILMDHLARAAQDIEDRRAIEEQRAARWVTLDDAGQVIDDGPKRRKTLPVPMESDGNG